MSAADAWALLADFTARDARGTAQALRQTAEARGALRSAITAATSEAWEPAAWSPGGEVILGVLAGDVRLGVRALRDWCGVLGLPYKLPESRAPGVASVAQISGGVFIKYNSASGLCIASSYSGRDRGVLVTLGQDQMGHFPLGLWDEAMANEGPSIG